MQLLTKRPDKMSFEDYKEERRIQNERLKLYLKHGRLCYLASEIYETNINPATKKEDKNEKFKMYRTYPPFLGVASKLKPL